MGGVTWAELAERARDVGVGARREAGAMDQRRAALSRSALVWWSGEAAEGYQRRVQERVSSLAELSEALDDLARVADQLADAAAARAEAETATAAGGGR